MNRNELVLLSLGSVWYSCLRAQSFPATVSYPTLRAVCEWRAEPPSLLVPSAPLWQSLLEYHFSEQPCQSFHSYIQGLHENSQRSPRQPQQRVAQAVCEENKHCPGWRSWLPGEPTGLPSWPHITCFEAPRGNRQEETPWSQTIHQSWGCCPVPSLWGH